MMVSTMYYKWKKINYNFIQIDVYLLENENLFCFDWINELEEIIKNISGILFRYSLSSKKKIDKMIESLSLYINKQTEIGEL